MPSSAYAPAFHALLPLEIWDEVAPFLTGWELVNLQSVSRDAHALFTAAKWWTPRLSGLSSTASDPQRAYRDQQSFAFVLNNAATTTTDSPTRRGATMALTAAFSVPFVFGRDARAFSIEMWFALHGTAHGGIVLGVGTPFHVSPSWHPLFETWVRVDEDCNLYSSILAPNDTATSPVVVTQLEPDRWHHLVLTFETQAAVGRGPAVPGAAREHWRVGEERVYVNGELATVQRGSLSRFWAFNSFVLLGTGCRSVAAAQNGEAGKQWVPFKGVVDDMKVWHSVLRPHDVKLLATHRSDQHVPPPVHSWKALATSAAPKRLPDHSLEFRGSHDSRLHSRGVSVTVVSRSNFQRGLLEDRLEFHPFCPDKSSSFAIEVWFYLLPEDESNWGGGTILGAQSRDVADAYTPARTRQLLYVDRHGRLFASVLDEIAFPSGAQRLRPRKWYHVVLRYQDGKQEVFLNGVLRRRSHGALVRDWDTLSHMQVGTGCVTSNDRGAPKGWYGFHGRIGDVRIWGPRLKDKHFTVILERSSATRVGYVRHVEPVFSLQNDGRLPHFVCVQNSRPRERVFVPRIDTPRHKPTQEPSHERSEPSEPESETSLRHEAIPKHEPTLVHGSGSSKWLRAVWQKATTALSSH